MIVAVLVSIPLLPISRRYIISLLPYRVEHSLYTVLCVVLSKGEAK